MSDVYRLVFRGEVLEGQHPAVVRKRLARAADLDDAALDKMFSGTPVVIKRAADTATAARFQVMFRRAGARLRVLLAAGHDDLGNVSPAPPAATPSGPAGRLELLPPGSDVLRDHERAVWGPREVDTSALSLAAIGENLGPEREAAAAPLDFSELEFEVDPAGTRLDQRRSPAAAAEPDTSHLRLADEEP